MTKDQLDRLDRLKALRDEGGLTEQEFEAKKGQILAENGAAAGARLRRS